MPPLIQGMSGRQWWRWGRGGEGGGGRDLVAEGDAWAEGGDSERAEGSACGARDEEGYAGLGGSTGGEGLRALVEQQQQRT